MERERERGREREKVYTCGAKEVITIVVVELDTRNSPGVLTKSLEEKHKTVSSWLETGCKVGGNRMCADTSVGVKSTYLHKADIKVINLLVLA